jgi:hypothetical protein
MSSSVSKDGHVRKMLLVPANDINARSNVNTVSLIPSTGQSTQQSHALSDPLERHLINLDESMEKILRNKALSEEEKLNKYLHLLRSFLLYKAKFNLQQSDPIPVQIVRQTDAETGESYMENEESSPPSKRARMIEPETKIDSESVRKYGRFKIPFAKTNILKSLANNIRPKGKLILDGLAENKNFVWNKSTGEMKMDDAHLPGDANLRDLLFYKIMNDLGEGHLAGDPPPHFTRFDQFLKREDIKSVRNTRRKGVPITKQKLLSAVAASVGVNPTRDLHQKQPPKQKVVKRIGKGFGARKFDWKNIRLLNY